MILVVDDEAAVRDIVRLMLTLYGYTVLSAGDGREGLETVERHKGEVEVALIDLMMPVMK